MAGKVCDDLTTWFHVSIGQQRVLVVQLFFPRVEIAVGWQQGSAGSGGILANGAAVHICSTLTWG